jgi:ElaB/YqjD/DUF883 family membrane-anchored ribosome-binding protein
MKTHQDTAGLPPEEQRKANELRSSIEGTRAELGHTIDAIQERLKPSHLKEQVKDTLRDKYEDTKAEVREATIGRVENMMHDASDTVSEARATIVETIRENPVPAALAGIGLAWLFMNARRDGRGRERFEGRGRRRMLGEERRRFSSSRRIEDRYGMAGGFDQERRRLADGIETEDQADGMVDRMKDKAGNMVDRVQGAAGDVSARAGQLAHDAQNRAGELAHRAQDSATHLAERARDRAYRIEHRVEDTYQENPLALGAVALAVGTAVGLALPQTRRENELMGEARDSFLDKAQEAAQGAMDKVQQKTSEIGADQEPRELGQRPGAD